VPRYVRLDSGNVAVLAGEVRRILDEGGLAATGIFASGDLDEYSIAALLRGGVRVDGFGVGTRLVTSHDAPALGGVYKLVESGGRPVRKLSSEKATLPGRHQVFRTEAGDTIGLAGERLPGEPLLQPIIRGGRPAASLPSIAEIRERAARSLSALPSEVRDIDHPSAVQPGLSAALRTLKERLT